VAKIMLVKKKVLGTGVERIVVEGGEEKEIF
jgi:hypothetical protein